MILFSPRDKAYMDTSIAISPRLSVLILKLNYLLPPARDNPTSSAGRGLCCPWESVCLCVCEHYKSTQKLINLST